MKSGRRPVIGRQAVWTRGARPASDALRWRVVAATGCRTALPAGGASAAAAWRPPWKAVAQVLLLALLPSASARAAEDLYALEAEAVGRAVARVAPSVVRIQTIGGAAHLGNQRVASGPTSGLIVSPDGLILSSVQGFAHHPTSILVTLDNGRQVAAKRIATDRSRMLVLLKIEVDEKLPVPEAAPETSLRVGAWAIAVGRALAPGMPNLSVGIISARERIFGRAVQTDAKLSPVNYGGALVDIEGRVIGIPVPLSPQGGGALAGVEWYDSGVGFAVPLRDVLRVLPRLKDGSDLSPGVLGISLKRGNPFVVPAEIAAVQPNSPAREAGLEPGDRIEAVDGHAVVNQIQLRSRLGRYYAGDRVTLALVRGETRIEKRLALVERIEPFQHALLGVLPMRPRRDSDKKGVAVRYVYPESPAARAGVQVGDRIVRLGGQPVESREAAFGVLNRLAAGDRLTIDAVRRGELLHWSVETVPLPEAVPGDLPAAHARLGDPPNERPAVGLSQFDLADRENAARLYVPENYDPRISYGLVVWFRAPSQVEQHEALVGAWKPICDRRDLIFLAPQPSQGNHWRREDARQVRRMIELLAQRYAVDPSRIVAHGYQSGGTMAYLMALTYRQRIRGVAAVDASMPQSGAVPANDPVLRLAVWVGRSAKTRRYEAIGANVAAFRQAKYPVTVLEMGDEPRYLDADELGRLGRWIDTLDRL